jgi:hypothetical protein
MNEEIKTLATIIRHQKKVSFLLRELAREFERRADLHDESKLQFDELEGFIEVNRIARQYAFGSPEYNESLKNNKAIELHFSRNSHHPEYHIDGIEDMDFIDFTEMVIDWIAANKTYNTTTWEDAMIQQQKRFAILPWRLALIETIVKWFKVE